jgi:hypothetical protein
MKWVYVRFSQSNDGKTIQAHMIHPKFAKRRIAYVIARYGATIDEYVEVDEAYIDLGGMIMMGGDERFVSVELGKDRRFCCWKHQLSWVVGRLKEGSSKIDETPGGNYHRFASFPGVLVFLSATDVKRIVKAFEPLVSFAEEQKHQETILDNLAEANVRATNLPKEKLKKIFRSLRGHHGNLVPSEEIN